MTNSTREQYDQLWSGTWGDMQRLGPVHRRQTEAILKLIANLRVHSILDVGCGSGDNLAALAQAMPQLELSGADVSPGALALAAQRVPRACLRELDVQHENLSQTFDLVMAIQVVEHLADDTSALRNMALMAKQWVLVTTMRGHMRPSEKSIGHLRNYSDQDLREEGSKGRTRSRRHLRVGISVLFSVIPHGSRMAPGRPAARQNRKQSAKFGQRFVSSLRP